MRYCPKVLVGLAGAVSIFAAGAAAREWPKAEQDCSARHFQVNDLAPYAESRDQRLQAGATNTIDPGENGSVRVFGWTNSDVLVRACIQAAAPSEAKARAIASQVVIARGPGNIQPHGPATSDQVYWNVSYEVWVPNASNLDVKANNGSIRISDVNGQIRFQTLNGSVHLDGMGGDVEGKSTNGSVKVELSGNGWSGRGLRAETTNGSVNLSLPENYSAQIEASTVNGRVRTDFPVEVSGEISKNLSFQSGGGGALIETRTVNGSVHIGRRG